MDEILEKCLESAKKVKPDVNFIEAADYGDYYLFSYMQNGYPRSYPAINKKDFKKRSEWKSADIFLDRLYKVIKL